MQTVIPEYRRMLVDVFYREFHRGHDTAADMTLWHMIAVWKETGNVDVAFFTAAKVDRFLAGALGDHAAHDDRQQQHRTTTCHRRRRRHAAD